MRAYLRVNLLAIWSSVVALAILRLVLGPSRTIVGNLVALVACGRQGLRSKTAASRTWARSAT